MPLIQASRVRDLKTTSWASAALQALRRLRYDVPVPVDPALGRHLRGLGIDTVLDVGANEGQYGRLLRQIGFRGRIVSFEPLRDTFATLQAVSRKDQKWECHQHALGEVNKTDEIIVSQCSVFSSFLAIHSFVEKIQPPSKPIRRESVQIRTLDSIIPTLALEGQTVWLKSDTQGFELQVLRGADNCLAQFRAVQLEMSIKPIYAGQPTFETMVAHMRARGFALSAILEGFSNPGEWELIECDGIFVNSNSKPLHP